MKRTVFDVWDQMSSSSACIISRVWASSARERLVHQQHGRVDGERAGEVRPLLHAARELVGVVLLEAGQADHVDEGLGPSAASARETLRHSRP